MLTRFPQVAKLRHTSSKSKIVEAMFKTLTSNKLTSSERSPGFLHQTR